MHVVAGVGHQRDLLPVAQVELRDVGRVHEHDHAGVVHAPEPVVVRVHGGVELAVRAQRHQTQSTRHIVEAGRTERGWRDEIGLAGFGFPLAMARGIGPVETARREHARIEMLELLGIGLLDRVTHFRVIVDPRIPRHLRIRRQRGLGQLRHDFQLGKQMRTDRLVLADRTVDATGGILGADRLHLAALHVDVDAPEARQQVRDFAIDQVRAVQLGGDLHRQPQLAPGFFHARAVGHRAQEIAAEAYERMHRAVQHAAADFHRLHARLARRFETVLLGQAIQRHQFRIVRDANRALALHVGMSAHRAQARARLADVAAQQQQVGDHVQVVLAEMVLRQAHAVDADRDVRLRVGARGLFEIRALQAGSRFDSGPVLRAHAGREFLEPVRVLCDELVVQHAWSAARGGIIVQREQRLADPHDRGDVTARLHLVVLRRDPRGLAAQHLNRILRVDEALKPAFAQRIEGDDGRAALRNLLQAVQHARTVGADVLAEEEHAISLVEVFQRHRADRRAHALLQRGAGGLVAHVRTVRQIVVSVQPREQRVHVAGFQRGAPRGVEDRGLRIELLQLRTDRGEGFAPFAGHVLVGSAVETHRMRQPADLLQFVVAPAEQFGQRVLREEFRPHLTCPEFPRGGLGAVLAKLERMRIRGLRPCARHAHEAVGLVLPHQLVRGGERRLLAGEDARNRLQ